MADERINGKGSFANALLISLVVSVAYFSFLQGWYQARYDIAHLSETERSLTVGVEAAVYYSIYQDLALATSAAEGFEHWVHNTGLQAPDTINVFSRFHVIFELGCASAYRLVNSFYPTNAASFYANSIFLLHTLGLLAVFWIGLLLSGSLAGAVLAALLFAVNHDLATRVTMLPPLRENASLVFLSLETLCLLRILRQGALAVRRSTFRPSELDLFTLFTLLHLATWQFSVVVLLLQLFILIVLFLRRHVSAELFDAIMRRYGAASLAAAVLLWGNRFYLGSPFFLLTIALVFFRYRARSAKHGAQQALPAASIVQAFLLCVALKMLLVVVGGWRDDNHLYSFVVAKLFGSSDYEIKLYLCSNPFEHVEAVVLSYLSIGLLLPAAALAASLILSLYRHPQAFRPGAEITFLLLQTLSLTCIAVLSQRFIVLLLPSLCAMTALLYHPDAIAQLCRWLGIDDGKHKVRAWILGWVRTLIYVALSTLLLYRGLASLIVREKPEYDPRLALVDWIRKETKPDAVLTASMPLSATLHLVTGRRINAHPVYEEAALRARSAEIAKMYGYPSEEEMLWLSKSLSSDYLILESEECFASGSDPECSPAALSASKESSGAPRFCERDFFSSSLFSVAAELDGYKILIPKYSG